MRRSSTELIIPGLAPALETTCCPLHVTLRFLPSAHPFDVKIVLMLNGGGRQLAFIACLPRWNQTTRIPKQAFGAHRLGP